MKRCVLLLLLWSSLPTSAQNIFSNDSTLRHIYNLQYDRNAADLIKFVSDKNVIYREAAALAFASIQDSNYVPQLLQQLSKEPKENVRIALVYSISQSNSWASYVALKKGIITEKNQNVANYYLEGLGKVAKEDLSQFYIDHYNKQKKRSDEFLNSFTRSVFYAKRNKQVDLSFEDDALLKILKTIKEKQLGDTALIAYLYPKILGLSDGSDLKLGQEMPLISSFAEFELQLNELPSPYLQLNFLKNHKLNAAFCKELLYSNHHILLRYHALDFLFSSADDEQLVDRDLVLYLLGTADIALISRLCEYLRAQENPKNLVKIEALKSAQTGLTLPRDYETWIDLEKTICQLEGRKYVYKSYFEQGYQNPIDWNYVKAIPQNAKVKITTNRGEIVLQMKVNEAPASVANFLKCVDTGYYNGKYFHRMVPNFVVQGGCPRGDGWGGLNWAQRSEFSNLLSYKKGSVGLASSGKDTEGVQFFITHTFTPHLDGRYTIFAEVISGLELINQMVVGDQMLRVEVIK